MPGRKHIPIGSDVELDAEITRLDTAGSLPPGGTTGEVLTKASDADGDADWEAGGGALPDPFVVTGTDPDSATATVTGATAQVEALLHLESDDDGSNFNDLIVVDGPNFNTRPFYLDSAGEVSIEAQVLGALPLTVRTFPGDPDSHALTVTQGALKIFDVDSTGQVAILPQGTVGLRIGGPHAAPPDAALNTGNFTFWLDQTNGATKLMIKAKSADGTVVTGQLALT